MRKSAGFAVGFALFNVLGCGAPIKVPPSTHPDVSTWDDLFSSDLSNAIFPEGIWTFDGGILTASEDKCIWSEIEYDNFVLDLEFRNDAETNSGVIVYCSNIEDWIPNSVEVQIADDHSEKWANSDRTWQCGAIFGHLPAEESRVKKPGEWNRYTITCKDSMIYVILNGEQVTEMDMRLWTSATTNPDGSEIPSWLSTAFSELPTKGHVGLQGKHAGTPISFRNLKIRKIE